MIKSKEHGYTLVELIIAIAVLMFGIVSVVQTYQVGIVQLNSVRLRGQVAECARLTVEYLNAMPADVVYYIAPGSPTAKTGYNAPNPNMDLNNYVATGLPLCSALSVSPRVALRYELCNGCSRYLSAASKMADPTGEGTKCSYDIALRVSWKDPQLGKNFPRYLYYNTKGFTNVKGKCIDPGGCGMGTDPESTISCSFPAE